MQRQRSKQPKKSLEGNLRKITLFCASNVRPPHDASYCASLKCTTRCHDDEGFENERHDFNKGSVNGDV